MMMTDGKRDGPEKFYQPKAFRNGNGPVAEDDR
jgi:hypothetical protein